MKPLDRQPELVLFDLDDTLCDYAGARTGRLRIAFGFAASQSAKASVSRKNNPASASQHPWTKSCRNRSACNRMASTISRRF